MNYQETLDYLDARLPMYQRIGAQAYKASLDNIIALCKLLGNPQDSFKTIHVAGTNGKGSVSHMLASILQEKGFRTGLYTSPHLLDFRERIRVNGKPIHRSYVNAFVGKHLDDFEKIRPSFFEMTTALAFDFFREQQVDIAVIEVGLGGRLDSTNIIKPILSVITNVSPDHQQFLGSDLKKIATEKAGIIKTGVPVVIGETQEELAPVFKAKARASKSEIFFADQRYSTGNPFIRGSRSNRLYTDVFLADQLYMKKVNSPLTGFYQRKNIVTVVGACDHLKKAGIILPVETIRKGIKQVVRRTGLQGRWQIMSRNPWIICDTGHNEGGLREVVSQIAETPHKHLHFVFGVVNDKQLSPIFSLLPENATYYFCKPDIPRGLDASDLKTQASKAGLKGRSYISVKNALKAAMQNAEKKDMIFIGGSTFVVAEALGELQELAGNHEGF
jgi:dihydrofolate synthase / folylpolyglutamate synthase